jgi:hypothetical protein
MPMTNTSADPTTPTGSGAERSRSARGVRSRGGRAAMAVLCVGSLGLAGCGESSEEKATKAVCSATAEINTNIQKLQGLAISPNFPAEAKSSVEAIGKSVDKIRESTPNLSSTHKQEIEAANKAFGAEIATITRAVVSAASSSNLNAALKSAEPQIKASLNKLASDYKKAFEALKCS